VAADNRGRRTIAIASGKGSTGKTTVAANLAAARAEGVALLDCDVEEPNIHLFIDARWEDEVVATVPVPHFDLAKCDYCGDCRRVCRFNAIAVLPSGPLLFPELCHSCGGCTLACPKGAIREEPRAVGTIRTGTWRNIHVVEGRLNVGEAKSPPLIEAVRQSSPGGGMTIIDAPPGTSCPVVAAVRGVDYVVLVTEPTPFGLHDLRLAVQMTRRLGLPFGVVVNRAGIGNDGVHTYCREENVPILAEIPDDRRIAEAYSRGNLIVEALPEYRGLFRELADNVILCAQ
jgi:MinD superfamily P-loop ATPase